jgi:hypothetical protein
VSELDTFDIMRSLRDNDRRLRDTEVKEVPGIGGSWVPFFEGTTIAGTFTYLTQNGHWWRLGRRVYVEFDIAISAIPVAPTGNMLITGLPIVSASVTTYGPVTLGFISNILLPAGKTQITALIPPGGLNRINLYTFQTNVGGALYPAASFTNVNCELIGGGWYEI